MEQLDLDFVVDKLKEIKNQKDWASEIINLEVLVEKLNSLNKVTSVRELSKLLNKSKSWVGVSLILIRGFKLYPEIEKMSNRNKAYQYLKKKNKMRRFIEHE